MVLARQQPRPVGVGTACACKMQRYSLASGEQTYSRRGGLCSQHMLPNTHSLPLTPHIPNSSRAAANASAARSRSASVCAADTCVRMRALPGGTTGYENAIT
jgi:hypothetical protein